MSQHTRNVAHSINKPPVIEAVRRHQRDARPHVSEGYIVAYWSSDPHSEKPLYIADFGTPSTLVAWVGHAATVFPTYADAVEAANTVEWIRVLRPEGKRIIKVQLSAPFIIDEDYPVDVLDALAEVE